MENTDEILETEQEAEYIVQKARIDAEQMIRIAKESVEKELFGVRMRLDEEHKEKIGAQKSLLEKIREEGRITAEKSVSSMRAETSSKKEKVIKQTVSAILSVL